MGYSRFEHLPVYRLRFEEFPGLVVRARPAGLRATTLIAEHLPVVRHAHAPYTLDQLQAIEKLVKAFALSLVDWNLEDDEKRPVPADARHLLAQDLPFVLTVIAAWMGAQQRAAKPAAQPPASSSAVERITDQGDAESGGGLSAAEQLLADLPTELGMSPVEPWPAPEDRGVALSQEPAVAAAQVDAWRAAPEPGIGGEVADGPPGEVGVTVGV